MSRVLIPKGGNDKVMTPPYLADAIVKHFLPTGRILEPCRGSENGAFYQALLKYGGYGSVGYCEIDEGRDFLLFESHIKFDWIITNPPFSQFRAFLKRSMDISDNIVFLSLVNAWFMKARLRDIKEMKFGFREIAFCDSPPKPWPQFGIQLGAVHIQRGWNGDCKFNQIKT